MISDDLRPVFYDYKYCKGSVIPIRCYNSLMYPIERYLNVQTAYYPTFSGDGRSLYFLSNLTGIAQIWRVTLDHTSDVIPWPEQLTFAEERVLWLKSSPAAGDNRLIFGRDAGGNENAQLFLLDPDNGRETNLTAGYENVMHLSSGEWSRDGRRFLFAANRRQPGLFDLYELDLDSGEAQLLWQNDQPGYLNHIGRHPKAERIIFARCGHSAAHELLELDLPSGNVRQLNPANKTARFEALAYNLNGHHLFVLTDLDSDFLHIARLDLATLSWEKLVMPNWDVELMELSPNGRYLAYSINVEGSSQLELIDLATGLARSGPEMNNETMNNEAMNNEQSPGLPVSQSPLPPRSPAIVIVHGGPESQMRPYFHFLAQYLAGNGYAVLAPNVRGSTGYGKAYCHLDDVEKRMDSVADLAYAAEWLKQQPEIDGDKIVVYGGSYGGFMVLAALTTYPDLWAAGVNVVGISNFVTFLENTSDYRRAHRESEYGSLAHNRDFLQSISPLNHLDKITAPLMIIHGANDPRVPVSEARQLAAALEARGIPVQLLIFDNEGHGIVRLKNKLVAYPAVVKFLEKVLA